MGIQQIDIYDVSCDKCGKLVVERRIFVPRGENAEEHLKFDGWKRDSIGEKLLCPNCEDE